jgi:hypothetical protein
MLEKSLKIKISKKDFVSNIPKIFNNKNAIYGIQSQLRIENDQYYWLVVITYEPNDKFSSLINYKTEDKTLPERFKEAVTSHIHKHKAIKTRVKNCINYNLDELSVVKKFDDFLKFRGIGSKSIDDERLFFLDLFKIIKQFYSD